MNSEPNSTGGVDASRLRDVQSWRRSRSDRMLSGVCGGVGRALNIDPVLIRVVVAVLTIAGGAGIPIYIAAWLLMPEEGSDSSTAQEMFGRRARPDQPWLWPVVIAVGVVCAVGISSSLKIWPFSFPAPLIAIIAIWAFMAHRKSRRNGMVREHTHWGAPMGHGSTTGSPAGTPPTGPSYPAGPSGPATAQRVQDGPQDRPQDRPQDVPVAPGPVWTDDDPLGLYVDDPAPAVAPAEHSCAKAGRGGVVKSSVLLLAAASTLISLASGVVLSTALAIGLLTLGIGMVVGAFVGRTRGLLWAALPLSVAVAATATFSTVPDFGDVTASPTGPLTAADTTYEIGVGSMKIDLTKATFARGTSTPIRVHADVGEITLIVPPDVDVTGTTRASTAGELNVFGQRADGRDRTITINDLGFDQKAGPAKLTVQADVKVGSIMVERG